jgi:hypothetical protein
MVRDPAKQLDFSLSITDVTVILVWLILFPMRNILGHFLHTLKTFRIMIRFHHLFTML